MGRKRTPGLYKRGNFWHIDKEVNGERLCESTGAVNLEEAEHYLAHRIETLRQARVYGVRPTRIFREAATYYLLNYQHKESIADDAIRLRLLDRHIGNLQLGQVHMQTLKPFISERQALGRKNKTINLALEVVRLILNLAATEWRDENGLTWLVAAPKIKLLSVQDSRPPYPLAWEEQDIFFSRLPDHLKKMALFKVNTGTREQEVCRLEWEWEIPIPVLNTSVFVVPGYLVKNGEDRVIVLNEVAYKVIEEQRGKHPKYVFPYQDRAVTKMNNTAWKNTRKETGIKVRVHDLKHTFGKRLRSAGVSYEDRQDLLGHKSKRITTHYSIAELQNLIVAANKACDRSIQSIALTAIRRDATNKGNVVEFSRSRKSPARDFTENLEVQQVVS